MDNQNCITYIAFESTMARFERTIARLWAALVIVVFLLVATNIAWISYESQFEDSVTVTQDTSDGNNNYIGHDGSITNGKTDNN